MWVGCAAPGPCPLTCSTPPPGVPDPAQHGAVVHGPGLGHVVPLQLHAEGPGSHGRVEPLLLLRQRVHQPVGLSSVSFPGPWAGLGERPCPGPRWRGSIYVKPQGSEVLKRTQKTACLPHRREGPGWGWGAEVPTDVQTLPCTAGPCSWLCHCCCFSSSIVTVPCAIPLGKGLSRDPVPNPKVLAAEKGSSPEPLSRQLSLHSERPRSACWPPGQGGPASTFSPQGQGEQGHRSLARACGEPGPVHAAEGEQTPWPALPARPTLPLLGALPSTQTGAASWELAWTCCRS